MSSYVASPFELETRRLKDIVQECQNELNRAIQEVQAQADRMAEIERARWEEEQQYYQSVADNKKKLEESIRKEKADRNHKKKQLANELEGMQIEIDAYSQRYGSLQNAEERQHKLVEELAETQGNLHLIEVKMKEHFRRTQEEIKTRSRESFGEAHDHALIGRQKTAVGVSLQANEDGGKRIHRTPSIQDLFSRRLKEALETPESRRIPGIASLMKEFDAQPEYAKSAFAVKNSEKLETYLKKLAALLEKGQKQKSDRKKTVTRYRAICGLLNMEPDEELLADPANLTKLTKAYQGLKRELLERKKRDYISQALYDVMSRHGIEYADAGDQNELYFGMENAELAVSGTDSDYLTMEITGQFDGNSATENDRRKSTAAARKFCSMLPDIEKELREEYGIVFKSISTEEPNEDSIVMKKSGVRKGRNVHKGLKSMSWQ